VFKVTQPGFRARARAGYVASVTHTFGTR
jgi:hypothetical protein